MQLIFVNIMQTVYIQKNDAKNVENNDFILTFWLSIGAIVKMLEFTMASVVVQNVRKNTIFSIKKLEDGTSLA